MKHYAKPKKLLSILLALTMIVASCSVCFSTFAADSNTLSKLADALKSETVKNLASYAKHESTQSGSGSNVQWTNKTVISFDSYDKYKQVVDLVSLIDSAIKETSEYTKYSTFNDSGSQRQCTTFGEINDEITAAIVRDYMTSAEMASYNVASTLSFFLTNDHVVTHETHTSNRNNVPARVFNTVEVTTDDYKGYLASIGTYDKVPSSVELGVSYTLTLSRENYTTGTFFKTNHYHNAFNVDSYPIEYKTDINNNTEVKTTLDSYNSYLDTVPFSLSYEQMLDKVLDGTLEPIYNEFKAKYDAIVEYVGSENTFKSLFASRFDQIDSFVKSCQSALDLQTYLAIAQQWHAFSQSHENYGVYNYGAYDLEQMKAAYEEFSQIHSALLAGGEDLLDYLNQHGNISLDYYNNFTDNIKVYDLKELAGNAQALYEANIDSYNELSTEEQQAVYSILCGYINSIPSYSEQVIKTIYPNGYDNLVDLQEKLFCQTNEFVTYFTKLTSQSFIDGKTEDIEALIGEIPEKLASLKYFYSSLSDSLGSQRANELLGALVEKSEALCDELYAILANRFTAEVKYADEMYKALSSPTELNVQTFIKLSAAFNNLEDGIYDFLKEAGKDDLISQETLSTYNSLKETIYNSYLEFKATYGFSSFEKSTVDYASREVYSNDKIKTQTTQISEAELENTISKLDKFLGSETFSNLIGGKDLSTLLKGTVEDLIYSDSFINTVVNLLYPLVLGEFENVWKDLPQNVEYSGMNVAVNYLKDLYTVLHEGNLDLYPQLVGEALGDDYAQAKEALIRAGRNWKDESIYDRNTGALTIDWGVDSAAPEEKAEKFYDAFSSAMNGLKPLIMALLCGQEWNMSSSNMANATVVILVSITLSIQLDLGATANDGYVNALVPVFEALGCKNLPTAQEVNSYTDLKQVAKAIIEPIMTRIDEISKEPVSSIVDILPNLLYALSFDMVTPILSMLKTDIAYTANADVVGSVMSDKVSIDVGSMLDLKSLGIDLSKGLDGILSLVGIELPGLDTAFLATAGELSTIDTNRVDYIYDNSAIENGKAYSIKADRADVAYYLLSYVVKLLANRDALTKLLGAFVSEEQANSIADTIQTMNLINTGDDSVVAIVELLNTRKYPQSEFVYPEIIEKEPEATPAIDESQLSEEEKQQLALDGTGVQYSEYWTKEKAQYVSDNLIPFVTNLFGLVGIDISDETNNLLSTVYTTDTLKQLVSLISKGLDSVLSIDVVRDVINFLSPLASVDINAALSQLMDYQVKQIKDGDRDAFVNELVDYLLPATDVLRLFVLDSSDGNILTLAQQVELYGYNGYSNAIIPILEAIGCDSNDILGYDEFKTLSNEQMLRAIIKPVEKLLDKIAQDPINTIVEILPNIIYFVDFDGLTMAVNNLLEPLYVLFDVIRPVVVVDVSIDLNLSQTITDALASLGDQIGLKFPGYSELSSTLMSIGKQEKYTTADGKQGVKLVVENSLTPEFITSLLRMIVKTALFDNNIENIVKLLKEKCDISSDDEKQIRKVLTSLSDLGTDQVLFVLFYAFFGVNTGVESFDKLTNLVSDKIKNAFEQIGSMTPYDFRDFVNETGDLLLKLIAAIGGDKVNDSSTFAGFLTKIISFFRTVWDWFFRVFVKAGQSI